MNQLFYTLPLITAFIALFSVLFSYYRIIKKLKNDQNQLIKRVCKDLEDQNIVRIFLEEQIDNFILDLKNQIPMGSMLFTPSLTAKIKNLAKNKFTGSGYDLKEKFIELLQANVDLKKIAYSFFKKEVLFTLTSSFILGYILCYLLLLWLLSS